jgi:hypothetical protein
LGIRLAYSLVFVHLSTRKVFLSLATYHPHGKWVEQQARNVMMWLDDHQLEAKFILRDRDTKFSSAFDALFKNAGIRRLRTLLLAPDANAYRPHHGLGNRTVAEAATGPPKKDISTAPHDRIHCQRFLGGLLRHYCRAA